VSAADLGLPGAAHARIKALPCVASYVGGDIVAGVLATGMHTTEALTLFVDIGTNGELVLGNKEWMVACACSAGPSFEGGGVLHGMRATTGAISEVLVDAETLEPTFLTVEGAPAAGICGSGLIDAVASLFEAGALDRRGRFVTDRVTDRIRTGDLGAEYVIARADVSATGGDIVLTESDIDNLLRSKAAVFAGISVMCESVDIPISAIERIVIAGTFGHHLDLDRALTLGLLPEVPAERFAFAGNTSLAGARLAAVSRHALHASEGAARRMTYLELSTNAAFMDAYMGALFLPHTDLSLFPEVARRIPDADAEVKAS
jgi:uncharacterized 2Fe-2S/4Fe-4S cluster protein (DUF4445 family)